MIPSFSSSLAKLVLIPSFYTPLLLLVTYANPPRKRFESFHPFVLERINAPIMKEELIPSGAELDTSTTQAHAHDGSLDTTTRRRPLYFAYGSNLSYSQMRQRCIYNPDVSSKPIALARLDRWRWIICQRGYANVVSSSSSSNQLQSPGQARDGEDVVYGVLYDMTAQDEKVLDGYEGIDIDAPDASDDGPADKKTRPKEQGRGSYNKWYIPATIVKWIDEDYWKTNIEGVSDGDADELRVLVYVDEERTEEGPPKKEYIARMNRGIKESTALGLSQDWVDKVMRKFLPEE